MGNLLVKDVKPNFKNLLQLHEESTLAHSGSLAESFGDALCLQRSPLARNIRSAFYKSGGKFHLMSTSEELDYYFLLTQLNFAKGYHEDRIYFIDTAKPLVELLSLFQKLEDVDSSLLGVHFCGDERRVFYKSCCFLLLKSSLGSLAGYEAVTSGKISFEKWMTSHISILAASLSLEFMASVTTPSYLNFLVTRMNFVNYANYPEDFAALKELFAVHDQKEIFSLLYYSALMLLMSDNKSLLTTEDLKKYGKTNFTTEAVLAAASKSQKAIHDTYSTNAALKYLISFGLHPDKFKINKEFLKNPECLTAVIQIEKSALELFVESSDAN